jgi:hypothetical protein
MDWLDFTTTVLPLAAFLRASGVTLIRCDRAGAQQVQFIFEDTGGKASRLADQYYQGALCPALSFYKSILALKVEIDKATGRTFSPGAVAEGFLEQVSESSFKLRDATEFLFIRRNVEFYPLPKEKNQTHRVRPS